MNIENFLSEMSGSPRTLWHFTNTPALYGILKTEKILGSFFDITTDTHVRKKVGGEQSRELATVRPSSNLAKTPDALSQQVGTVKLIISPHIMSDKVRNIKVTPIAEFPLQFSQNIDEVLRVYKMTGDKKERAKFIRDYLKWYTYKHYSPKYDSATRDVAKNGLYIRQTEKRIKDLQTFFKNRFKVSLLDKDANEIDIDAADYLFYASSGREGEERITKPSGTIPLNSSYIKIELRNGFSKSFIDNLGNIDFNDYDDFVLSNDYYDPDANRRNHVKHSKEVKRFLEEWKSLITKNSSVFINDKEFSDFKIALDKQISKLKTIGDTPKSPLQKRQLATNVLKEPRKISGKVVRNKLYFDETPKKISNEKEFKKYTGIDYKGINRNS